MGEPRRDGWGAASTQGHGYFTALRYMGQLDLTFLVCEGAGELVLIDQHAAHERVELHRLRERAERSEVAVQRLLFPESLEVTPALAALADDAASTLAQVGFLAERFGEHTVAVKAVPAGLAERSPGEILRGLLGEWAERRDHDPARAARDRLELVLATVACHSVVRAGDRMTDGEAEALLRSMDGLDAQALSAHTGPHGRPVLLRVAVHELARRLGR